MSKFLRLLFVGGLMSLVTSAYSQTADNSFFDESGEVSEVVASNLPTSGPKDGLEPIEMVNPRADDIFWQKVVYRIIDLREKMNYPFYYPEQASDNRQSLFALMFKLLQDGKVKAYEYDPDREIFDDDHLSSFSELIGKFEAEGKFRAERKVDSITNDTVLLVNESDVPNRDVFKYYAKEVWYFDKITSSFCVKLIALCPIYYGDLANQGTPNNYPLFWIPFDSLRPFLSQTEVLISDRNNGARPSFDDLFMKRRFASYIYKESNIQNRMIVEYGSTVDEVKKVQDQVKTQLINFENDLWEY